MNDTDQEEWEDLTHGEWESFRLRMLSRGVTRVTLDIDELEQTSLTAYGIGNAILTTLSKADPTRSWSTSLYGWLAGHLGGATWIIWLELDFEGNTIAFRSRYKNTHYGQVRKNVIRREINGLYHAL